jgi:hypothetical protein
MPEPGAEVKARMKGNLETNNLFLETQAFVAEQLNFDSENLYAVRTLARERAITLLTTDATVRECKAKIAKRPSNARLLQRFDEFLRGSGAVWCSFRGIPFQKFEDDCEAGKFPLGKKQMLKDAAPLLTLNYWCEENGQKTYVISADEDVRNVCLANAEVFLHLKSVRVFVEHVNGCHAAAL